jgi:hypothetical protein
MSAGDASDVRRFVASINLQGVPTHSRKYLGAPPPRFVPRRDEDQAIVIGSQLQAFARGVDEGIRQALENAMLLAQLAADKKSPQAANKAWYRAYFDTLNNLGLAVEGKSFVRFTSGSIQADVHKAVLELAASLLGGPATTAYKLVAATLGALLKLDAESPAITIFSRETRHERTGRFQVSVAENETGGEIRVSLMGFSLEASASMTQVLFAKLASEAATLDYTSVEFRVSVESLSRVADDVAEKVAEHIDGYVRHLEI